MQTILASGQNTEIELFIKDSQILVSSRVVAEDFGKMHKDVLKKIEQKVGEFGERKIAPSSYFIESTYKNSQNKLQKEYLLTRDGFSFIVMGFTGKERTPPPNNIVVGIKS